MRKVLTYTSIDELRASPLYRQIRCFPQICMSSGFSTKLRKLNIFPNTITFREILESLAKGWKSNPSKVTELALISKIIHSRIDASKDVDERLWLKGCMKHTYDLWSAITMLEEANIKPDDLSSFREDRELALLQDVWKSLESSSDGIKTIRNVDPNETCIQNIRNYITNVSRSDVDTIVIHGFYFITPIQERMMRVLETAGYQLLFIFLYDDSHRYANEIWRLLYNDKYKLPENEWLKVGAPQENRFGDLLEKRSQNINGVKLIEYRSLEEFVNDVRPGIDSPFLFSPDYVSANDMLKEFYPELYGKRPLITYPIGGFIELLHRMWDSDTDSIILDPDLLSECFSYGWLTYKGKRSNAYMLDLQKLIPFFRGCRTENDWNKRLKILHEIQDVAVSAFPSDGDRWKMVLGNPLNYFSMFDVDGGGTAVVSLIGNLIRSAKSLFGEGHGCLVNEHLNRLQAILNGEVIDDETMRMELKAASDALNHLKSSNNQLVFLPTDISNAISMYLRNEYGSDDMKDEDSRVSPLYGLETIPYDRVHIVLANQKNLPGGNGDYVWPLDQHVIEELIKCQIQTDDNPLLENTAFITKTTSIANRYLTYSAFLSDEVTISWIRELDGKTYPPSPYIELIRTVTNKNVENIPYSHSTKQRIDTISDASPKVGTIKPLDVNKIPDIIKDFSLCPRMFLYDFVLNRNPTFISEFQQGFAISGLLSAMIELQKTGGFDKTSIDENVFGLFPYLSEVEVQNIRDNRPLVTNTGMTRLDDFRYSDLRFYIRYPSPIKKNLTDLEKKLDLEESCRVIGMDTSSEICMYCPHSYHCPEVRYKDDKNGE